MTTRTDYTDEEWKNIKAARRSGRRSSWLGMTRNGAGDLVALPRRTDQR